MEGNKRILFSVLSMQKVTDKLSSKHHLSFNTNLMIVLN